MPPYAVQPPAAPLAAPMTDPTLDPTPGEPAPPATRAPRPIRSFVLRTGRMGSGQRRALAELAPSFVLP